MNNVPKSVAWAATARFDAKRREAVLASGLRELLPRLETVALGLVVCAWKGEQPRWLEISL